MVMMTTFLLRVKANNAVQVQQQLATISDIESLEVHTSQWDDENDTAEIDLEDDLDDDPPGGTQAEQEAWIKRSLTRAFTKVRAHQAGEIELKSLKEWLGEL